MTDHDDNLDQPEEDGYELAVPFTVCRSAGGPYDDDAFVAGFQAGRVDHALAAASAVGATEMQVTVMSELVKQLDLIAMNRGFRIDKADVPDETPEWTFVTFRSGEAA